MLLASWVVGVAGYAIARLIARVESQSNYKPHCIGTTHADVLREFGTDQTQCTHECQRMHFGLR